ncbi:MAG: antibiotic biosynthesis monooxygenase family protein [Gemmatimonadales bacterium]
MVARTWRGSTRAEDADRYLDYLHRTGLAAFQATPGNKGAIVFRRVTDGGAEFFLVSLWESLEAVRRFAGQEEERAVFFPEDDRYLVERDLHVDHFDVVYAAGELAGAGAD